MSHWANDEVKSVNFGDKRLDKRLGTLLEQLGDKPNESIPVACGGWAETLAAYRFFDNEKVTLNQVLSSHVDASIKRIACHQVVLLPQDTTDLVSTINKGSKGLGTIKETEKTELFLHPTIAITPDRVCLGVVGAEIWKRTKKSPRSERRNKPINEKESSIWLNGYQTACEVSSQVPETLIVNLADREGDIYEWFLETEEYSPSTRAEWIIRAAQNRVLSNEDKHTIKLWDKLEIQPILGTVNFTLPASGNRDKREVKQIIKSARVTLKAPSRTGYKMKNIEINAVLAVELNPPLGVEPLTWLLLTSLPVESFEQASTILEWYIARWEVEVFFKVLKSGCKVEELQLETIDRMEPCLALYLIIAWRTLFVTKFGRIYPYLDCEFIFTREEWQAVHIAVNQTALPSSPPSLGEMLSMIAHLGGHLGRKHDGPPGPQSIWIGLQRMRDFVLIFEAIKNLPEAYPYQMPIGI